MEETCSNVRKRVPTRNRFRRKPGRVHANERGVDAVIGDILNPPFKPLFDVVFTFGVLQHVSKPFEGLRQLDAGFGRVVFLATRSIHTRTTDCSRRF